MVEFICGMVAAIIAYSFNRLLFKWQGEKSILFTVPLVEELSKSLIAFFIGGYIIGVHLVFGIIEALYDLLHAKNKKAGPIAAIISIISHSIFGTITYYTYLWTGSLFVSILVTTSVHSLWNYFVTR